jgi:chlorobactene glucosyltransferase
VSLAAWALAVPPGIALAMTIVNAVTWPHRGRRRFPGSVSVLVPARNEGDRIAAAVRAIAASSHPLLEIVVFDDGSTDATPAVLEALRAEVPSLVVLRGEGPAPGWIGKPHACHQLFQAARGDHLVFVDADVELAPDAIEQLAAALHRDRADLVTAVPRQVTGSLVEALVVPVLLLTYLSWLPLRLVALSRDPRFTAANGQLVAVARAALASIGGFAAVRSEIVDDVALARRFKRAGLRVAFADGTELARCRMYRSPGEVWRGFSKNVHEGVGGTATLALVVLVYLWAFVAPWLALPWVVASGRSELGPVVAACAANLAQRSLMVARWRQPISALLLHPASVLAAVVIAANSTLWSLRNQVSWSGRVYPARRWRGAAP